MYKYLNIGLYSIFLLLLGGCTSKAKKNTNMKDTQVFKEQYRPQYHFSPMEKWMNDPNGLVYHKGMYHLFYQYYPEDIVWGPMHWGHAISEDMIHWEHRPIALYPDEQGYIFSGSAVVDHLNSSGFGTQQEPPLVAIFTYHEPKKEEEGAMDFQTQGIAYSADDGETWTKYQGNPVLGNDGIKDFRDPKVFWHKPTKSWIMVLVAGDHAKIYRSDNLKKWEYLSSFGQDVGAHGGVWECPDLFPLKVDGLDEEKWVLLISINPGAPNGGSGTQYFVGDFDGATFTSDQEDIRWIDWGTDNYAGVTYNNTPNGDRIFIGWMSNWNYARDTPTERWRSAMTLARKLSLRKGNSTGYDLINYPLKSVEKLLERKATKTLKIAGKEALKLEIDDSGLLEFSGITAQRGYTFALKNKLGETLRFGIKDHRFFLDRSRSGQTDFQEHFADKAQEMMMKDLPKDSYELRFFLDLSSIEIFINKGQYVMTAQVFPNENYESLHLTNELDTPLEWEDFGWGKVNVIWD